MWPFRRDPTIGDYVAESLEQSLDEWSCEQIDPFMWEYWNSKRGWRVMLYSSPLGGSCASFDQCRLTSREERRIKRVLFKQASERANDRREVATRRAALRAIK